MEVIGRLKNYLLTRLTKRLLRIVTEEDILRISGKDFLVGERKLTPEEIAALKEEARTLKDSFLWRMMTREIEYLAFLKMSYRAARPEDIIHGNAMFYSLDMLRKYLKNLSL